MFAWMTSFVLWRIGQVFSLFITFSIWDTVFTGTESAFGFSRSSIFTYLFVTNVCSIIVTSTRVQELGQSIRNGELSTQLLQPISPFLVRFSIDLGDKLMNVLFGSIEIGLIVAFFHLAILSPNLEMIGLLFLAIFGSIVLFFLINACLSMIAFWSPDIWSPRFLFFTLFQLLSGSFFPITALPQEIQRVLQFTPFPYFLHLQANIWLERITVPEIWFGIGVLAGWIALFFIVLRVIWRIGLREFGAEGR